MPILINSSLLTTIEGISQRNYGNAVYVSPFEGDPDDAKLDLLANCLTSLTLPRISVPSRKPIGGRRRRHSKNER